METVINVIFHLLMLLIGVWIILRTLISAIRTLVLARSARDPVSAFVFLNLRRVFEWRMERAADTYERRDALMALYAPIGLLLLPMVWLSLLTVGYGFVFWAMDPISIFDSPSAIGDAAYDNFTLAGSSLLTLGFQRHEGILWMIVSFSDAAIGLIMVAMLISYLPTMYSAFSRREAAVTMLEVRAGSPPSAVEMLTRAYHIRGLDYLETLWEEWELWFADVEESHTSLSALVFFRSPKPHRSWITAAGTVLDTAALYASTLDRPRSPQAELCIRAGYVALRSIADFFNMDYNPHPLPTEPISITRDEFMAAYEELKEIGVPLRPDPEDCWQHFAGWRVNYDGVLLSLATLTVAPYAKWISDRSRPIRLPVTMRGRFTHHREP